MAIPRGLIIKTLFGLSAATGLTATGIFFQDQITNTVSEIFGLNDGDNKDDSEGPSEQQDKEGGESKGNGLPEQSVTDVQSRGSQEVVKR